jgi:hypothetical protein
VLGRPRRLPSATGSRRWLPRWTLRLRLTLLYGSLFLVAGAVLLAITYGLVAHDTAASTKAVFERQVSRPAQVPSLAKLQGALPAPPPKGAIVVQTREYAGKVIATFKRLTAAQQAQLRAVQAKANAGIKHDRQVQLDALLTKSGVALADRPQR